MRPSVRERSPEAITISRSVGRLNRARPQKGAVHKTTASVRQAFLDTFEKLGGVNALTAWAKENPTEFYRLWATMLPREVEVTGKDNAPLTIRAVHE